VDGIELVEEAVTVPEEEVQQTLENLRRSRGSLNKVEGPAGMDHYVLGDLHMREGAEEKEKAYGAKLFQLTGSDAVPELLGKQAGNEVTYVKDYPADDNSPLAGKKVHYRILVREVKEMVLPALDDAFAASVAKNKTLENLMTMIRDNLRAEKEHQKTLKQREDVMNQLLARVDIPIPEPLLEGEKRGYLRKLAAQLYTQAVDVQKIDWEKLGKDYEPQAMRNLQTMLLLKKLAEAWDIAVTDEELLEHIRQDCHEHGRDYAKTMKKYREDDLLDDIRMDLRMSRTWDAIFEKIRGKSAESKP
jgi:trigger factor